MTQKSHTSAATGALGNGLETPAPTSDIEFPFNRKPGPFRVEGRSIKPRQGLAHLLDMMISARNEGIDRHMCSKWCADLPSGIRKLRKSYGLDIETVKGKPTRYVLQSSVSRDKTKP